MNATVARRRRPLRDERGAALVEFALSSLVFFLIVFGTMEFGRMMLDYNIVSNAAREGVRYASVRGASSGRTATEADVRGFVASRSVGLLAPANVTVTWPNGKQPGSIVQVQVHFRFTPVVALMPSAAVDLRSTTQMVIVR